MFAARIPGEEARELWGDWETLGRAPERLAWGRMLR